MKLSARNQIPATVTGITAGEATANIELDAGGVRLVASITIEAARDLGLAAGSKVTAVIKASDVIVAVQLSPGGDPCTPDVREAGPDRQNRDRIRPALANVTATETCPWPVCLRGRPLSLSHCDYLPIGLGHASVPARGNVRLAATG